MADMNFGVNLLPTTDLGFSLGSSSKRWKMYGNLTGNAATATKLANARTISLTGAVTGSGSFDGSGNLSISTTADSAGKVANKLTFGSSSDPVYSFDGSTAVNIPTFPQVLSDGVGASVTTQTNYCVRWKFNAKVPLVDGQIITFKVPVAGRSQGVWISVDNGTTYKPIATSGTSRLSTQYAAGSTLTLVYESSGSVSIYPLNGGSATSTVTGGVWRVMNYYVDGDTRPTGYCSTAKATATKDVYLSGYTLSYPGFFYVNFTQGNTATSNVQLNVNWTGAKPLYLNGNPISSNNYFFDPGTYKIIPIYSNGTTTGYHLFVSAEVETTGSIYLQPGPFNADISTLNRYGWFMSSVSQSEDNNADMLMVANIKAMFGEEGMSPFYFLPDGTFIGQKVYGAVWNDYAEYRKSDVIEPGRVIFENGDDTLALSTERLQRGCEIISDTFGFAIGKTDECKTPIAASGRVLAYPYEDREEFRKHIGWPVCSGPNGTVSIMTEEEEEKYPSRIIGTVSAVPDYEEWGTGKVKVNGRVWIRLK